MPEYEIPTALQVLETELHKARTENTRLQGEVERLRNLWEVFGENIESRVADLLTDIAGDLNRIQKETLNPSEAEET